MEEDLINKTSIQFPTVTNTSDNDSFLFDDMTPMIEIPTSIVLRQLEEGEYVYNNYVFIIINMYVYVHMYNM